MELPPYEHPPPWIPPNERSNHPGYSNNLEQFFMRSVTLLRERASDPLGFNIRGGKEHFCGIYFSKVTPNTEAEHLGLKESDQIISANGTNFEDIEHTEAVKILKSHSRTIMKVRNFPYGYRKTYENLQNSNVGIPAD
ncbi:PDZ domain-containing protein 11 [Chionoecetes opilio]|uniref:PDZ domain-containing protein 11 n=1 Tax=Chionoecetes opilio TaxID=41210 RepID=A0A8J5D509_CHIOP|nr:PDZ domain-containing protein 11 [Chionoecetes opilio]